jgi:hypothetical protein
MVAAVSTYLARRQPTVGLSRKKKKKKLDVKADMMVLVLRLHRNSVSCLGSLVVCTMPCFLGQRC